MTGSVPDVLLDYHTYLPPDLRGLAWRLHPLDGKLLFDRDTGLNALLEGDETAHLRRAAPRTLLVAITNTCNLTCPFCYRDLESRSLWRYDALMQFCREADEWGVLEVAFGGGEPMLFPRWQDFICELYETTRLCVNFTTNGKLLTENFLRGIAGKYGNIRLSLYEDNKWEQTVGLLVKCGARFGVNWLITPAELPTLEAKFGRLLALGVRDFLLLGYKGADASMHLQGDDLKRLAAFVNRAYAALGGAVQLKLDVCWGDALPDVPRLFTREDCGAGDDFLSITSDRHVKLCSFQHTNTGLHFDTMDDLKAIWGRLRERRQPALIGGCARLPGRGLNEGGGHAVISLAAV